MTTESSAHLSEEAMNDVLIGLGSPESEAHIGTCAECRSQLQAFQANMQLFNQTSLAWSETRSATLGTIAVPKRNKILLASAGWALAATVLLGVGVPMWMHNLDSVKHGGQAATAPVAAQQDSVEQIAQDNELMHSVDMALSSSEVSPISEYQTIERPREGPKARPELRHP